MRLVRLYILTFHFGLFTGCSGEGVQYPSTNGGVLSERAESLNDSDNDENGLGIGGFPRIPVNGSMVVASGRGQVVAPERCGNTIGAGANYVEGIHRLAGKCNNGGVAVRRVLEPNGDPFLLFETDGTAKKPTDLSDNDRTELAYTPMIPFGKTISIAYQFKIPKNSDRNILPYSAIQFWQCANAAPIAVMQVDHEDNRKAENQKLPYNPLLAVNFITRDYKNPQVVVRKVEFAPDVWNDVRIVARISPTNEGRFQVWFNRQMVADSKAPSGVSENTVCTNRDYRVKFGIYKGNEPRKKMQLMYRNFRMNEGAVF